MAIRKLSGLICELIIVSWASYGQQNLSGPVLVLPTSRNTTGGELRISNIAQTYYEGFTVGAATSSVEWALPLSDTSGCWQSNGSGVLSISTCASPGGASTDIQYNNGSGFGGSSLLTFNPSTGVLSVGGSTYNSIQTSGGVWTGGSTSLLGIGGSSGGFSSGTYWNGSNWIASNGSAGSGAASIIYQSGGNIGFYGNSTGLTAGSSFTPTLIGEITPTIMTFIGHLSNVGGSVPSISGTGCSFVGSPTDVRGVVTSSLNTTCSITFGAAYSSIPVCPTLTGSPTTSYWLSTSTTVLDLVVGAGNTIGYACIQ